MTVGVGFGGVSGSISTVTPTVGSPGQKSALKLHGVGVGVGVAAGSGVGVGVGVAAGSGVGVGVGSGVGQGR